MKKTIINIQVALCTLITAILMLVLPLASASWTLGSQSKSAANNGLKIMGEFLNGSVFGQVASKSILFRIVVLLFVILTLIMLIVHIVTAIISIFSRQKRLAGILFSAIPLGTFLLGFILYMVQASSCLKNALGSGSDNVKVGLGFGWILCLIFMILILVEEIFLVGRLTASDSASAKGRKGREPVDYGYPGSDRGDYGYDSPAYRDSSYDNSDYGDSGYGDSAYRDSSYRDSGYGDPAYKDSGYGDSYREAGGYRDPCPAGPAYTGGPRSDYDDRLGETVAFNTGRSGASMGEQTIRCLSGEYEGATLPLKFRETMYVGRDHNICNVVLANPRVSRKHCSIQYDVATDTFKVVNYSKNGVFVEGQRMETNRPYQFPHGTIIKISDADLFQLM